MNLKFSSYVRIPRIVALRKFCGDPTPAIIDIAHSMENMLRRNIINEGSEAWARWQPMKPLTEVKRRAEGKPARLLYGFMNLVYSTKKGKTQVTFGFNTNPIRKGNISLAQLHHEGRAGKSWVISARPGGWLFFPVTGKVVKRGRGKEVTRAHHTIDKQQISWQRRHLREGLAGPPVRLPRYRTTVKGTKEIKSNYILMKKVTHKGFPARPLLPPKEVTTAKAREIIDGYIARAKGA